MQIGVFSDVHDNLDQLRKVLALYTERGIETAIFCGDFCSPVPVRIMGGWGGMVHCVFGNGDGDRFTINSLARDQFPNLKLHGEYAELELGGRQIAVTHYPFYAQALARTGDYDAVFSGHKHEVTEAQFGDCLWLNPGEVMGAYGVSTCAIYDTDGNSAEIITL